MAKCKYILQLPGGGQIELPASFSTLEKDKAIDKLFSKFISRKNDDSKEEMIAELITLIRNQSSSNIHGTTLRNIISKSKDIDEFYNQINALILNSGSYETIDKAIYNYIQVEGKKIRNEKGGKTKTWRKITEEVLKDFTNELNQPRNKKYFEDAGLTGVLGATSLHKEYNRIRSKNQENRECGFPTNITDSLELFIKQIYNKDPNKDSNIIYGARNNFIGKAWTSENLVMYELDDDLSLFLGLFKREAIKVDTALLLPILERINKNVKYKKYGEIDLSAFNIEDFFLGKLEGKKIKPSIFESILEKAVEKDIAKEIDAILNLVAKSINPKDTKLIAAIKTLFWQLSPNSYGKNDLFKQLESIKIVERDIAIERTYKESLLSFIGMEKEVQNEYFALKEIITDDVYQNAIKNITPNKDVVKFDVDKYEKYALVTQIYERPNNRVAIYGIYKNQFGEMVYLNQTFEAGKLAYRKREEMIAPYDKDEIIVRNNGALISSTKPMGQKLIKQLVQKGDMVNGDLVLGIYPGYLYVQKPDKSIQKNYYNNIRSIYSAKALAELDTERNINPNGFVQVEGSELSAGDYFLSISDKEGKDNKPAKSYKKVLYADKDNVYSWVIGTDTTKGVVIKATSRKDLKGLRNAIGEVTSAEILKIKDEKLHIGTSKATMSSFSDPNMAREGDYFSFIEDEIIKYGKVLEEEKIILINGDLKNRMIKSLDSLPQVQFFTDRDISSNYSLFTIRANSYAIDFKAEAETLDVEFRYVVPKNTTNEAIKNLTILTNGYANIGTYKAVEFVNPEEDRDITEEMLKALDKQSLKVFGKKVSSNSNVYERNLESLTEIKYFNKLDSETKLALNILTPGTYFSLYKESSIDRNIYRINSISNGVVKAQLNKLSPTGRVITNEIDLSIEELLASGTEGATSPVGSIGKLYIINGNDRMGAVIREVNNLLPTTDKATLRPATNKAINKLIKSLKSYTKGLKIDIKVVPAEGNFKAGEKAKIETTADGKTSILINDTIGQTEDVLHEFLHLFLTPLRYKYPEIYNQLISSIVKDNSLNVTEAEELFVKFIASKMEMQSDFIGNFEDLNTFVKGIQTILTDVDAEYTISEEDNPITLLNTPLMDLFNIDRNDNSNPMYNLGMITTEPMMREWMKNNNIVLNCS